MMRGCVIMMYLLKINNPRLAMRITPPFQFSVDAGFYKFYSYHHKRPRSGLRLVPNVCGIFPQILSPLTFVLGMISADVNDNIH